MTVHRTFRPRAWSTAAAAAFVAGLASTTGMAAASHAALLAAAASDEPAPPGPATMVPSVAASPRTARSARATGTIGLRPDPANPHLLVVDFGAAPA
jgi:hypothetical protein